MAFVATLAMMMVNNIFVQKSRMVSANYCSGTLILQIKVMPPEFAQASFY